MRNKMNLRWMLSVLIALTLYFNEKIVSACSEEQAIELMKQFGYPETINKDRFINKMANYSHDELNVIKYTFNDLSQKGSTQEVKDAAKEIVTYLEEALEEALETEVDRFFDKYQDNAQINQLKEGETLDSENIIKILRNPITDPNDQTLLLKIVSDRLFTPNTQLIKSIIDMIDHTDSSTNERLISPENYPIFVEKLFLIQAYEEFEADYSFFDDDLNLGLPIEELASVNVANHVIKWIESFDNILTPEQRETLDPEDLTSLKDQAYKILSKTPASFDILLAEASDDVKEIVEALKDTENGLDNSVLSNFMEFFHDKNETTAEIALDAAKVVLELEKNPNNDLLKNPNDNLLQKVFKELSQIDSISLYQLNSSISKVESSDKQNLEDIASKDPSLMDKLNLYHLSEKDRITNSVSKLLNTLNKKKSIFSRKTPQQWNLFSSDSESTKSNQDVTLDNQTLHYEKFLGTGSNSYIHQVTLKEEGKDDVNLVLKVMDTKDIYSYTGTNQIKQQASETYKENAHKEADIGRLLDSSLLQLSSPTFGLTTVKKDSTSPNQEPVLITDLTSGGLDSKWRDLFEGNPSEEISPQKVEQILSEMAISLLAMHTQGIGHGDVKLDNFFYKENPNGSDIQASIADFGMSKQFDSTSETSRNKFIKQASTDITLLFNAMELWIDAKRDTDTAYFDSDSKNHIIDKTISNLERVFSLDDFPEGYPISLLTEKLRSKKTQRL